MATVITFEEWLKSTGISSSVQKKYLALVSSAYIGLVFKAIMGWSYDCVGQCRNSNAIKEAIDKLLVRGSAEQEFNSATYGTASSALGKYCEYLVSIGL